MVNESKSLYVIQVIITLLALFVSIFLFTVITIFAFFAQVVRKIYKKEDLREYFITCAIGEDQKAGSYLYGTEDYTISSYTYLLAMEHKNKKAILFMKIIDFIASVLYGQTNHCETTYKREVYELRNGGAKSVKEREQNENS